MDTLGVDCTILSSLCMFENSTIKSKTNKRRDISGDLKSKNFLKIEVIRFVCCLDFQCICLHNK